MQIHKRDIGAIISGIGIEILFGVLQTQVKTMPIYAAIIGYIAGGALVSYGIWCIVSESRGRKGLPVEADVYLDEIENSIIKIQAEAERLYLESRECTPDEYIEIYGADIIENFQNQWGYEDATMAVVWYLVVNMPNPRLKQLFETDTNWKDLYSKIREARLRLNNRVLNMAISKYFSDLEGGYSHKLSNDMIDKYIKDREIKDIMDSSEAMRGVEINIDANLQWIMMEINKLKG